MADDPRDKQAVGYVDQDGTVVWFDDNHCGGVPDVGTLLFTHHWTEEQIKSMEERAKKYKPLFDAAGADLEEWRKQQVTEQLVGRHRWMPKDGAEYAANQYGSELAGDVGNCKICDQDMFASIHISPLDPDPEKV
jgi:hypothetical protein